MNRKNNMESQPKIPKGGIEGRLEAMVALTAGIFREIVKDPESKKVTGTVDKVIASLYSAGVPQAEIGKILGVDINRVNHICKILKRK